MCRTTNGSHAARVARYPFAGFRTGLASESRSPNDRRARSSSVTNTSTCDIEPKFFFFHENLNASLHAETRSRKTLKVRAGISRVFIVIIFIVLDYFSFTATFALFSRFRTEIVITIMTCAAQTR